MARYIDADAYEFPGDLLHVPTADVVEVVRCKDCKYYDGFYSHRCTNTDLVDSDDCYARIDFAEDDFCSYGERKEGET